MSSEDISDKDSSMIFGHFFLMLASILKMQM